MIDFDPIKHKYSNKGIPYTSATQIVEKFKNPFDTEGAAQYVSEKRGGSPEMWKDTWKEENAVSLVRGNNLHDSKELIVETRQLDIWKGKVYPVPNKGLLVQKPIISWPDGTYLEEPICNHQYRIAGKPDKFILYSTGTGRYVDIHDYKSNKLIRKTSYLDRSTNKYTMMLPPISHLMCCNFIEYTLQLSIYMFMFQEMGFKVGTLTLEHHPHIPPAILEVFPDAQSPKPVIDTLKYLRNDVLLMLKHLKAA